MAGYFNVPAYNPTSIESPQNALLRGLEMQRAQRGNALQSMQLQALIQRQQQEQAAQAQAAAREQQRQTYLGSVSGQVGPPAEFNPLQAFAAGFRPDEIKALQPQQAKPYSLSPGGRLVGADGRTIAEAPFKPEPQKLPPIGELQSYADTLPPGPKKQQVQAQIANMTRAPKYATAPTGPAVAPPPKPLPPGALKMEQDALDKIGIASSINADLAAIDQQIKGGKLKFGPVSNLANAGLNMAGISTEESRNFASFKSTLERLRNESLRLNTGVQTDGDAQRAWNELFQNINDTGLVQQRLAEIRGINKRGAELQKLRADGVRANYGLPPVDAAQYEQQPAAIKATNSGPAVGAVENGYRFKGGDPAQPSSWERVK